MSIRRNIIDIEDTQLPSEEINEINIAVGLTEATLKCTVEAEYNRIYRELNKLNLFTKTMEIQRAIGLERVTVEEGTREVEMDIFEIYSRLKSLRERLQQLEKLLAKSNQGDNK